MKPIFQESIIVLSIKKVTTLQGSFLIGIASNEKFYFDFLTDTGDYFIETKMPVSMARGIWTGHYPVVISIEPVTFGEDEQ